MADVVDVKTRSRMMSGIRSKNTRPELLIRSLLHRAGFRFRLHKKTIPGRPDLFLSRYKAAIFVHGCFWHGHDCSLFKMPGSRTRFWQEKIGHNQLRDQRTHQDVLAAGYRCLTIWECALKGPARIGEPELLTAIVEWLVSDSPSKEIRSPASDCRATEA